jgi:hypothetical protein
MSGKRAKEHYVESSLQNRGGAIQGNGECRGRRYGVGDLVECQSDRGNQCKYALSFGYSFFCRHPERKEFAD